MSAARLVVCPGPKPFVMGLPCVFVIGLLASTIRPRLPVIGADVRQIREPHSGETAIGSLDFSSGPAILKTWTSWGVPPLGISMFPSTLLSQTTLVGQVNCSLED